MRNRLATALKALEKARPGFRASDFDRLIAVASKPEPRRADIDTAWRAYRRAVRKATH